MTLQQRLFLNLEIGNTCKINLQTTRSLSTLTPQFCNIRSWLARIPCRAVKIFKNTVQESYLLWRGDFRLHSLWRSRLFCLPKPPQLLSQASISRCCVHRLLSAIASSQSKNIFWNTWLPIVTPLHQSHSPDVKIQNVEQMPSMLVLCPFRRALSTVESHNIGQKTSPT